MTDKTTPEQTKNTETLKKALTAKINLNKTTAPTPPVAPPAAPESKEMKTITEEFPAISIEVPEAVPVPESVPEYQTYICSRVSTILISKIGQRIRFSNFTFITKEQSIIDYLDEEIAAGLKDITKGERVFTSDKDPMAALRAKHFKEFEDQKEQEAKNKALGITRNMGDNRPKDKPGLSPLSTNQVAN